MFKIIVHVTKIFNKNVLIFSREDYIIDKKISLNITYDKIKALRFIAYNMAQESLNNIPPWLTEGFARLLEIHIIDKVVSLALIYLCKQNIFYSCYDIINSQIFYIFLYFKARVKISRFFSFFIKMLYITLFL